MSTNDRCIHRMVRVACAFCSPPRIANVPKRRNDATVHAAGSIRHDEHYGIVVVDVKGGKKRADFKMANVDSTTTMVHMCGGLPYLWAVEEILRRAPNLKKIQVIPSMMPHCNPDSHVRICRERGVEIVAGHIRPDMAWEDGRSLSKQYEAQRLFMSQLSGHQKSLFDELLILGFECALVTSRYFVLNGEEVVSQGKLAKEFGFGEHNNATVSEMILGTLYYIDDTVDVGDASKRRARAMKVRVERLRPYLESAASRQRLIAEIGAELANDFPLAKCDTLRALVAALRDGRMSAMRAKDPRAAEAVCLRFGLDDMSVIKYRKLATVGEMLGGVSRERARQLEERALAALGIVNE